MRPGKKSRATHFFETLSSSLGNILKCYQLWYKFVDDLTCKKCKCIKVRIRQQMYKIGTPLYVSKYWVFVNIKEIKCNIHHYYIQATYFKWKHLENKYLHTNNKCLLLSFVRIYFGRTETKSKSISIKFLLLLCDNYY